MQRPGPLQELPLEHFLPTHSNLPSNSVRSHKRPLSPGSPNPYSPTKRRILNSEGIFTPEKTCKTPLSLAKASPARFFSDVLAGPASPARVLDFGLPKNHGGEPAKRSFMHNPIQTQIPSKKMLASSSELKDRIFRCVSSVHQCSSGVPDGTEISSTSSTRLAIVPIDIPQDLPPPPDPQSIHYPGFVVFRDTHITIYPADFSTERVSDVDMSTDPSKENIPPRRKTLRKAALEVPKSEVTPSTTRTPNRVTETHRSSFSTHVRQGPDLSSSCSPMKIDARKKLRRMMEDDDLVEGQNDDDE